MAGLHPDYSGRQRVAIYFWSTLSWKRNGNFRDIPFLHAKAWSEWNDRCNCDHLLYSTYPLIIITNINTFWNTAEHSIKQFIFTPSELFKPLGDEVLQKVVILGLHMNKRPVVLFRNYTSPALEVLQLLPVLQSTDLTCLSTQPGQPALFMSVSGSQCFSRALVSRSFRREIIGRGSSFRPAVIMALS